VPDTWLVPSRALTLALYAVSTLMLYCEHFAAQSSASFIRDEQLLQLVRTLDAQANVAQLPHLLDLH
jgi:hypothetical protein